MQLLAKIRSYLSLSTLGKYIILSTLMALALLVALLTIKSEGRFVLILIAFILGIVIILLCYTDIRLGFYTIIGLGFIVASVERIFMNRYPLTSVVLAIPCLLICFLLFKETRKKQYNWLPWHPVIFVYFISFIYMIVEIFNPEMDSLLGWLSSFWQSLSYLFLLFISGYMFKNLSTIRFFFKFLVAALFITALYGCLQQWFGLSPFDYRWVHSDPHIAGLYSLPGGGLRKFSLLTDPANFGTFMAAGAVTLIVFIASGPFKPKNKFRMSLFTAVIVLGMSYSGTRTANFMLVAGLALYILMTIYQKRTQILAVLTAIIFLFVLYIPIYGNVTLNRFRTAFKGDPAEDASMDTRLMHRELMQPYMHAHPFGGGVNTSGAPGSKYNPHHFLAGFPPDGAYFGIALNMGWVGLAVNCLFLFVVLFYCIHYFYLCQNPEIKTYYAATGAMLFALYVGSYAQFTISSVPQSLIFVPLLAIIAKLHTFDRPKQNN